LLPKERHRVRRYDPIVRREADILIVGAGIIGCAIARELTARGASVQVAESRDLGRGATQASAGVLAPYIEGHEGGPLLDLTLRSLKLYDRWIETVRAESGIDIEYRRSGSLQIALDEPSAVRLRASIPRLGLQSRLEWLDARGARAIEPALSPVLQGALSVPMHGYVSPSVLTRALARAASARGAEFHRPLRIARLEPRGACVDVTSAAGESWQVKRVILAAGSWSGQVDGVDEQAPKDVRPVKGQLLRVEWRGRPLTQVIWGPDCYVVPRVDGTVLIGATTEHVGFDERTTASGVRALLEAARTLLPGMEEATFLEARAGLRPGTSDGLPIIGQSPGSDRLVYAIGHYRNGVLLAPLTAELVSDLVLDGRSDPLLAPLSPARPFTEEPFRAV
jgi:glycine oxidase